MSTLALVIVIAGLMIIASRAPLVFAPEATRAFYLKLFETDARMRTLGGMIAILGALLIWGAWGENSTTATAILAFGVLIVAIAAYLFIAFPHWARKLATSIWGGFSTSVLRLLGLVAVVVGLAIATYGLSL